MSNPASTINPSDGPDGPHLMIKPKKKRTLSLTGMVLMMSNNILTDIHACTVISQISADISTDIATYSSQVYKAETDCYNNDILNPDGKKPDPAKTSQYVTKYQQDILPMQNAQQQLQGVQDMWTKSMQSSSTGMSTVTQAITSALNNLFEVSQLSVQ